jgi:hypothetical protein
MNKLILFGGAVMIAVAGVALAQPGPGPRPARDADTTRQQVVERVEQRFSRMDVNRDGRFTREEAQQAREQRRAQRAERMFDRLDLDRDGSVTRQEMSQAQAQRQAQRAERGERGERRGMRGMRRMHRTGGMPGARGARGAPMFGEQGFVTLAQLRDRALARFDRADANRDGTLTAAERQQTRAQFRQRRQERRDPAQ